MMISDWNSQRAVAFSALVAAAAMVLGGCTTPDPEGVYQSQVSEFDVGPLDTAPPEGCLNEAIDFSGEYFFALSVSIRPELPILFLADVTVADDLSVFDISFQIVSYDVDPVTGEANPDPRQPVGDPREVFAVPMNPDGTFEIVIDDWFLPGAGNPVTGGDLTADVVMTGNACNLDHFCGTADGEVIGTPLTGSTFGAVRLEEGADIVTMGIEAACIDYNSGDDTGVDAGDTGGDTGPDPTLVDQCINPADQEIVNGEVSISGLAADCGLLYAAHPDEAVSGTVDCMQNGANLDDENPDNDINGVDISAGCASCYANTVLCSINNCFLPCASDPSGDECFQCQVDSGCIADFELCFGEEPLIDQCNNLSDHELVEAPTPDISGLAADCGLLFAAHPDDAVEGTVDCMQNGANLDDENPDNDIVGTDITAGCASCYADTVLCSINNCFLPCASDPSGEECFQCQVDSGCISAFEACYGEAPVALCNADDLAALDADGFTPPDEGELNTCAAACDGVEMDIDDCVAECTAAAADATGLTFICTSCFMEHALCTEGDCEAAFADCTAAME